MRERESFWLEFHLSNFVGVVAICSADFSTTIILFGCICCWRFSFLLKWRYTAIAWPFTWNGALVGIRWRSQFWTFTNIGRFGSNDRSEIWPNSCHDCQINENVGIRFITAIIIVIIVCHNFDNSLFTFYIHFTWIILNRW